MPSPWVTRALASDLPAKALDHSDEVAVDECDYCGFATDEGAVLVNVGTEGDHAVMLCTSCSKDKVLGQCGHRRTCDCLAGICD